MVNTEKSYILATKAEEPIVLEEKKKANNLLKNGWTLLKSENNKTIITNPVNDKKDFYEKKRYNEKLKSMIDNWNHFRDTENELMGDRSPFINYKKELDDMIKEEEMLIELMNDYMNKLNSDDSDYISDDESNKHLIF
jgi:superfamily I DNA/RNA helicase